MSFRGHLIRNDSSCISRFLIRAPAWARYFFFAYGVFASGRLYRRSPSYR